MAKVDKLEERLNGHETLCEERHSNINRRFTRLEAFMYSGLGTAIALLIKLAFFGG